MSPCLLVFRTLATHSRFVFGAVALILLHVTHPLTWGRPIPDVWFAPVGISIALVAWFGPRILWLVVADCLLVAMQAHLTGMVPTQNVLVGTGLEAILNAAEAWVAWWCYSRLAKGSRSLDDPRSATLFLFLIPGLVVGVFAAVRALGFWLTDATGQSFLYWLSTFWLSGALGVLAVTPFLLVVVTPYLARLGLVDRNLAVSEGLHVFSSRLALGDWLEIGGLALGTSLLGLMLLRPMASKDMAGWQLWGLPLLLIVWASLRHGLRGGALVTASAAVFTLGLASVSQIGIPGALLQSNVLAQCSTALLVAASATCIRNSEARYRQVVGHIPVVLYSARVSRLPAWRQGDKETRRQGDKEHNEAGVPATHHSPGAGVQITFVSPASSGLLGKQPDELIGSFGTWLEHVDPRDREVLLAAVRQLHHQQQPVTCEYRLALETAESRALKAEQARAGRSSSNDNNTGPDGKHTGADHSPLTTHHSPAHDSKVISHQAISSKDRWVRDTLVPDFSAAGVLEGWQGVVTDITEQRVLADDLRRTTTMFHALVANLPAGVFFVQGLSGRPILVNARARQLLGQREDPAAGLEHLSQVYRLFRHDGTPYPVDELPVTAALRRGASCMRDDIVVHRPDGRNMPLVSWAAPIQLSGHSQPDAAVWVLEDLTALHKAEEARRKSEARLRAVIETMAEALIVQDQTGKIIECNPAGCAILGLGQDQFRGRSLLDSGWNWLGEDGTPLPADDHPVRVSCRTGQPVRNVVLGIPQSEVRWVVVNCMPLALGQDKVLDRVVTTLTDITAYRHALDVLKLSEEKYRGLVETLPLMVVQFDNTGRIVYVNPAAQKITGYSLDDLPEPAAWQALLAPEDLQSLATTGPQVLAGQTVRMELHYRAKDGSERIGHAIIQPRWHGTEVAGMTALIVDMTLQRRLEQDLQRAQRLDLVGRLASGIAHDFNNLLTVVLTLTELARDNIPADHPSSANLRRAAEAGQQAIDLAEQLLAFSRQKRSGKHRIDVNVVARRTLDLLHSTLPASIDVTPILQGSELNIDADELQIQQVLMNLCLNARDAMPNGGRLVLRADRATAVERQEDKETRRQGDGSGGLKMEDGGSMMEDTSIQSLSSILHPPSSILHPPSSSNPASQSPGYATSWVRLSVEDTGLGMTESVQAKMFDPFFSTKERGTGLGLAVVQQIVEACHGQIVVHSQPGVGTRFEVFLPCDPDPIATESDTPLSVNSEQTTEEASAFVSVSR